MKNRFLAWISLWIVILGAPLGAWAQERCGTCAFTELPTDIYVGKVFDGRVTIDIPDSCYTQYYRGGYVAWGDGNYTSLSPSSNQWVYGGYNRAGEFTIKVLWYQDESYPMTNPTLVCETTNTRVVPPCSPDCAAKVEARDGTTVYWEVTAVPNPTTCQSACPVSAFYTIDFGDGSSVLDGYLYRETNWQTWSHHEYPAVPKTYTWKVTAHHHGCLGDPAYGECTKTGTITITPPSNCLTVGNLNICATTKTTAGGQTYFSGNVRINEMLFFSEPVTYTGTPSTGGGRITTDGDILVKLQSGDYELLEGPDLAFDVDGFASKLFPRLTDPDMTYSIGLGGVPLLVNGLPIEITGDGVVTRSTFYVGILNVFTLVQAEASELYPPGGKRKLLSAKVVNGELVPSIKFQEMSLTYDPQLDKLEGKISVGFPFIDGMWSVDLAVRVVQGCFNGMDLTLPLAEGVPLFTTGFKITNLTVRMDNICVGQFWIFFGGDLGIIAPPVPGEIYQIKDAGFQYTYPLIFDLKGGAMTLLGYPMTESSGRINLKGFAGTFKTSGNFADILQGETRFDLIVPKAWFMGRYTGKFQIPDFQCAWTSLTCRAMKTLLRSVVTLPYLLNEQSLEFNADYNQDGTSFGFFRGMVNIPSIGGAAVMVQTQPGEIHLLVGTNLENLFEVTESAPLVALGPESAEKPLVLSQPAEFVVFSAAADAVVPSIYLRTPEGTTITPATVSSFPGVTYASSDPDKVALFRVTNAAAGTWTLGVDNLSADQVTFQALAPKTPPATAFTSVTRSGNSVSIAASVEPPGAGTKVSLLYSQSNDGSVEGMIAQDLPATAGSVSATWDLSELPTGNYYIVARTDDGMNPPEVIVYDSPISVDQGFLQPPEALAGNRNGGTATLTWTPSPSPSAVAHTVLYTDAPLVAGYPLSWAPIASGTTTVDGLDLAKDYRFCVKAYDAAGNLSPASNAVTLSKPGGTPGDCDGDGAVSIGEVQKAINMFLGSLAAGCNVDTNGDGSVSIGEVQKVINEFLGVVPGIAVSVTPSSVGVLPNGTQQFAATVTGSTNIAVTWSVQEGPSGGTVTGAGLYTAPATPGTYHVKATSQADPSKSATATVTVSGGTCSLTCTASASPTSGQAPLAVNFTATATPSNCSGNVTYAWTFGDGGSSSQQNPSHTYATAGTYAWTMTASIGGQTCTKSGSVTVAQVPTCTLTCTASAHPTSGQAPLEVNFTADATATNCPGTVAYAWAFGDGSTSATQNPYKVYASVGTYSWSLTVSADGQTCTQSGIITVTGGSGDTQLTSGVPVNGTIRGAQLNATWNYYYLDVPTGVSNVTVDVTNLSDDVDLYVRGGQKPDLALFDCRSWDYGTAGEHCAVPLTGPVRAWIGVTNFAINTDISYTVTATAGGGGCALTCSATAMPTGGLTVQFGGQANASGCGAITYFWEFGDGNSAMEQNPTHTYASPGTYSWALLVVAGNEQCISEGTVTVP